ncbi:MAG: dTDP-4-dehydrorhamnose 3,5-epimerase [candidate division FCPU426 bacterium]
MKFTPLSLSEVVRIEPRVFSDARGFFMETYHQTRFAEHGLALRFVQDNHSRSAKGVLRGLHFQREPRSQGKLVRALRGAIFDVAVDIRRGSPTFGRWVGEVLSEENKAMLFIPPGFAHGFCAMADATEVHYKTTDIYSPEHEGGLLWDDPEIGIAWPDIGMEFLLSDKDKRNPRLRDLVL